MSENNARLERDLYDHEYDEPRSSGSRRRRPVADWGVGDDVFDHMPRNRFSRAADGPPRERRFSSHAEPAERRGREDAPAARAQRDDVGVAVDRDDEPAAAASAPEAPEERARPDVPRGRRDDGRRTIVIGRPEDVPSEIAAIAADRDIPDDPPPPEPEAREAAPAPGERRTIRIGGRPEGSLEATRAQRRRPPRTAHERVGHRPDRLAAWAVALGLLLILIAVLTAL
jgi:hypothetical protein